MSNPSKELESILETLAESYYPFHEYGDTEHDRNRKSVIEAARQIEELIALREREARIAEWQRIYDHFENLDPRSKMPDVNNPRRSVLIELNELKKGEE